MYKHTLTHSLTHSLSLSLALSLSLSPPGTKLKYADVAQSKTMQRPSKHPEQKKGGGRKPKSKQDKQGNPHTKVFAHYLYIYHMPRSHLHSDLPAEPRLETSIRSLKRQKTFTKTKEIKGTLHALSEGHSMHSLRPSCGERVENSIGGSMVLSGSMPSAVALAGLCDRERGSLYVSSMQFEIISL